MTTIYLAGPECDFVSDENCWRRDMAKRLVMHSILENASRLTIEAQKSDIRASDIVIAYCPGDSTETGMQVMYAYEQGKAVIGWVPLGHALPDWLHYHCDFIHVTATDVACAVRDLV